MKLKPPPESIFDKDRLFPIQYNDIYGISVGRFQDKQGLIFPTLEGQFLVEINLLGELLRTTLYPYKNQPPESVYDKLVAELEFTDSLIRVRCFFFPEYNLGVRSLSSPLSEYLEHPERYSGREQEYYEEDLAWWKEAGYFSLYWGQEYYADATGAIISS